MFVGAHDHVRPRTWCMFVHAHGTHRIKVTTGDCLFRHLIVMISAASSVARCGIIAAVTTITVASCGY
jgi:hypothetical protein